MTHFFDLDDVLEQTAALLEVGVFDLLRHAPGNKDRRRDARSVAMFAVRQRCGLSYPETGRLFGRHHTSVMSACARVEATPNLFFKARHVAEGLMPIEGGGFS